MPSNLKLAPLLNQFYAGTDLKLTIHDVKRDELQELLDKCRNGGQHDLDPIAVEGLLGARKLDLDQEVLVITRTDITQNRLALVFSDIPRPTYEGRPLVRGSTITVNLKDGGIAQADFSFIDWDPSLPRTSADGTRRRAGDGYPTVAFEVGYDQTIIELRKKAARWLCASSGLVFVVILLNIQVVPGTHKVFEAYLEVWRPRQAVFRRDMPVGFRNAVMYPAYHNNTLVDDSREVLPAATKYGGYFAQKQGYAKVVAAQKESYLVFSTNEATVANVATGNVELTYNDVFRNVKQGDREKVAMVIPLPDITNAFLQGQDLDTSWPREVAKEKQVKGFDDFLSNKHGHDYDEDEGAALSDDDRAERPRLRSSSLTPSASGSEYRASASPGRQ